MTDITELALIKGQKVEAPYYLAECTECGKLYSSSKLIVSRNYFDGDADCYCPHCNADDADIADLGSGEQPAVMAWNYQQARIDVLVEALEKAQQVDEELCKLLPLGAEYMDPPDGGDVTPLEGVRRMVADYRQRIAELESRTVKLPKPISVLHRREFTAAHCAIYAYPEAEVNAALDDAGIEAFKAMLPQPAPQSPGGDHATVPGKWIPVSVRMPDREVDVQVYCPDKKEQMVAYLERNELEGYFRFATWRTGDGIYCQPTHWMQLPAGPREVKGE
ncbi:TPA: DUF551 domain-containing protein [Klebsiella variicola subsp. variicola]